MPPGFRLMTSTRSTSGWFRHSSRTPSPTMPVAPVMIALKVMKLGGLLPNVGILWETGTLYSDHAESLAGRRLHHHPALETIDHLGAELCQAFDFGGDIVGLY